MAKGKRLWRGAALGFSLAAASVQAGQVLVPEQSEIRFMGQQMGVPTDGRFQKFTVDAALDPAAIEKSAARIVIDMNGIALSAADLTTEIKRKRWFDTAAFPEATFESKWFRALGEGRCEVGGTLTIKGVSRDGIASLMLKNEGQALVADGQFELKRLAFNVGDGPWADIGIVANEVQVRFKFRLRPQP